MRGDIDPIHWDNVQTWLTGKFDCNPLVDRVMDISQGLPFCSDDFIIPPKSEGSRPALRFRGRGKRRSSELGMRDC